jgi:predicted PurR-regulated permease PerM
MQNNPFQAPRRRRSAAFYIVLAAALFAFIQAYALLAPVLFAFLLILLISLALNPVVVWIQPWMSGRVSATLLVICSLLGIAAFTGWLFLGPLQASLSTISERLPEYWERVQRPIIKAERQAERTQEKIEKAVEKEIQVEEIIKEIQEAEATGAPPPLPPPVEPPAPVPVPEPEPGPAPEPPRAPGPIRSGLTDLITGVAGSFMQLAFNATQMLVVLVTAFFGVIFTLMNPRPIIKAMFYMVPEQHHARTLSILQQIGFFVPRWAGATLLAMFVVGLLVFLIMWPIFGFVDALVLGMIAGVLEIIPFLGPVLSLVPALLLAIGKGGMTPLWVVLGYAAVQAIESNIIVPLIMARGMQMHPVAVIFSMLLCVVAFGVLGVLIAPPMVAVISILHEELYRKRAIPTSTDHDLDRMAQSVLND